MDPEIAEKFALRDRVMRRMYMALTMEQRVERMRQLNEWGVARLAQHPEGHRRFIERNLSLRAFDPHHGL